MITKAKPKRAALAPAKRRATARPGRGMPLSRERIAAAAMALVDREGLEAMSIYHHFPGKAHLMDALVDMMLAEARVPLAAEWDWLERLRRSAHGFRAMALKHPKFFPFFAVHRLNTRAGVAFIDGIIGIFRDAGFSDRDAAAYFRELGYYLTGAALDETAGYARGPSAAEPVSDETIAADFRNLAAAARYFQAEHFQAIFETGLEMLLAGIERAHHGAGA
jgi:AcrR family transcriptional regulator